MYHYNNKTLIIDYNEKTFAHNIRSVEQYKDTYIVLLSIPYGDTEINNLYGLDSEANIIWQSEDISTRFPDFKNILPYEQFGIKDGYIFASDFLGRNYQINAANGKIENCCLVK